MGYKKKEYKFYVYIMVSISGVLYVGVTNNLIKRVWEHKNDKADGFTKKYKCHKLVYYEFYQYVDNAINREKQIKKWNRKKKEFLINKNNIFWNDLVIDWY
ncbi:GIY-YIG nuclease family protein [Patescibacteria group bacterium]